MKYVMCFIFLPFTILFLITTILIVAPMTAIITYIVGDDDWDLWKRNLKFDIVTLLSWLRFWPKKRRTI